MPLERSRYPRHWEKMSRAYRSLRDWQCQQCGVMCRHPGESLSQFCQRTQYPIVRVTDHPKRFCLSTAHLNQRPGDNHLSNWRALCTVCHLRHDRAFIQFNRYAKREHRGQLNIRSIALIEPTLAGNRKDPTRLQPGIPLCNTPLP